MSSDELPFDLEEARRRLDRTDELRRAADALRLDASNRLTAMPKSAPVAAKADAWRLEEGADEREMTAYFQEREILEELLGALPSSPGACHEHPAELRKLIAEIYLRERTEAARRRDRHRTESLDQLIGKWLPERRNDFKGGYIWLETEPAGATVRFVSQEIKDRRLVDSDAPPLDAATTPLSKHWLEAGSYTLEIESKGYTKTRLPIEIAPGDRWYHIPPDCRSPQPLRLPLPKEFDPQTECHIAAGWFISGGDENAVDGFPRRKVWLDTFFIQRDPVTCEAFYDFLLDLHRTGRSGDIDRYSPPLTPPDAPSGAFIRDPKSPIGIGFAPGRGRHPVSGISWEAACAYAAWYSAKTGVYWTLPHEQEWEKAARGVDGRFFPWGDHFEPTWTRALDSVEGIYGLAPVDDLSDDISPFLVRGSAGNVREWCRNAYTRMPPAQGREATEAPPEVNDAYRVARGGSFLSVPSYCRSASRFAGDRTSKWAPSGFRLVRWPRQTVFIAYSELEVDTDPSHHVGLTDELAAMVRGAPDATLCDETLSAFVEAAPDQRRVALGLCAGRGVYAHPRRPCLPDALRAEITRELAACHLTTPGRRTDLLAPFPPSFRMALPMVDHPVLQIGQDLAELDGLPPLSRGARPPLELWLKAALRVVDGDGVPAIRAAIERLGGVAESHPSPALPTPLPRDERVKLARALAAEPIRVFADALGATIGEPVEGGAPTPIELPPVSIRIERSTAVIVLDEPLAREALSNLRTRYHLRDRHTLIIDRTAGQRLAVDYFDDQVIVIDVAMLLRLTEAGSAALRIFERAVLQQANLGVVSPYSGAMGVADERMFVGRYAEIEAIGHSRQSFVLVGARQMGKTALLHHLHRRAPMETTYLGEFGGTSDEAVRKIDLEAFARRRIGSRPHRVLIDEADIFVATDREANFPILRRMRKLVAEGACSFVIAGAASLTVETQKADSPLLNFGDIIRLGPLEEEATRELIVQPFRRLDVEVEPAAVDRIIEYTGRRPNLVTIICNICFTHLARDRRDLVVRLDDVEALTDLRRTDDARLTHQLGHAMKETPDLRESSKDRLIVYSTIDLDTFDRGDIRSALESVGVDLLDHELEVSLDRLEFAYVITNDGRGRLTYPVPLVRQYIAMRTVPDARSALAREARHWCSKYASFLPMRR